MVAPGSAQRPFTRACSRSSSRDSWASERRAAARLLRHALPANPRARVQPAPPPWEQPSARERRGARAAEAQLPEEKAAEPPAIRNADHERAFELAEAGDLDGACLALAAAANAYNGVQDLTSQVTALLELTQLQLRVGRLDAAEQALAASESVAAMTKEMKQLATQVLPNATYATIPEAQERLLGGVRLSLRAALALLRAEQPGDEAARARHHDEALFYAAPAVATWRALRNPERLIQADVFRATAALGLRKLDLADEVLTNLRGALEGIGGPPIHLRRCYELLGDLSERRADGAAAAEWRRKAEAQRELPDYG